MGFACKKLQGTSIEAAKFLRSRQSSSSRRIQEASCS
jgi:hypothetical protein